MAKKRKPKRPDGSKKRAAPPRKPTKTKAAAKPRQIAASAVRRAASAAPAPPASALHDSLVDGEQQALVAKFALAPAAELRLLDERERSQSIPWGYGRDKVTAMAVDPERLYVYWEVTDEAIAKAHADLGRSGDDSWLDLRVHDVTGLLFDGSNAHHTLDAGVGRSDRQWFLEIGRPTSEVIVELGLLARDGRFAPIARSKRVEFPRREPAPPGPVEWLDVRPVAHGGDRPHLETIGAVTQGEGWHGTEGVERREAGPIPIEVALAGIPDFALFDLPDVIVERRGGEVTLQSWRGFTRVVYGPWSVAIRGLRTYGGGRVLARWEIRKSWVVEAGAERFGIVAWSTRSTSRRGTPGGTLGGASEALGASETLGASEARLAGASERRLLAGSELRLGGASELHWLGASELNFAGASERRFAGASEQRLGGASEARLLPSLSAPSAP